MFEAKNNQKGQHKVGQEDTAKPQSQKFGHDFKQYGQNNKMKSSFQG